MIDVHCHYYPERYTALMSRLSGPQQPRFRHPTTDMPDQIEGRLQGLEGGANDYIYVIIQPQVWVPLMKLVGRPELIDHPQYATPEARISHLDDCFGIIEQWTLQHDKLEAMRLLNEVDVPCGPILSMKDLHNDASLRESGTLVEVVLLGPGIVAWSLLHDEAQHA